VIRWRGTLYGTPVEGTVQGGACHGSFEVVSLVEAMVAAQTRIGAGPVSGPADLTHPVLARAAIAAALDAGTAKFEGDEAPVEPVPEGAES
jgi:hypothetical protein